MGGRVVGGVWGEEGREREDGEEGKVRERRERAGERKNSIS